MLDPAEPVPAEEEQADEGRLEEERHQALDRQRRAEDVADVVRVVGPVGAELELQGDAGGHAHGEVDAEQDAPELGHALPDLATGHHVDRLHDREHEHQAERQRHEQEVIQRGQGELQARKIDNRVVDHRAGSWWFGYGKMLLDGGRRGVRARLGPDHQHPERAKQDQLDQDDQRELERKSPAAASAEPGAGHFVAIR